MLSSALAALTRALRPTRSTPTRRRSPLRLEALEERCQPAVVAPVLKYSSYFGGNNSDEITSVKVDDAGFIYVAGRTDGDRFPGQPVSPFLGSAFVAKLNPAGTALIWSARLNV